MRVQEAPVHIQRLVNILSCLFYVQDDEMKKKTGADTRMAGAPLRPEDSRWYHPTLNPTGAPPPGKVRMSGWNFAQLKCLHKAPFFGGLLK